MTNLRALVPIPSSVGLLLDANAVNQHRRPTRETDLTVNHGATPAASFLDLSARDDHPCAAELHL